MLPIFLAMQVADVIVKYDDSAELKFVDQVLYAWACWTTRNSVNLKPTSIGQLLGITCGERVAHYQLDLTEDQLLLVEKRYSQLANRLKIVIQVEYFEGGSSGRKARNLGLSRISWRETLKRAQMSMYNSLLPDIDNWQPDKADLRARSASRRQNKSKAARSTA